MHPPAARIERREQMQRPGAPVLVFHLARAARLGGARGGPPRAGLERGLLIDAEHGFVGGQGAGEQGRHRGVKTPVNDAVVEAVRSHGVGKLKPDPKNLEPILKVLPKR